MRLFVLASVALFLAPTLAVASTSEPEDGIAVTVTRIEGKGVYVTWTPVQGAVMYDLYRGTDLSALQHVGQTPNLEWTDWHPPAEDTWYEIISQHPESLPDDFGGPMRGHCLALRGATGVSITIANCMPSGLPIVGSDPGAADI